MMLPRLYIHLFEKKVQNYFLMQQKSQQHTQMFHYQHMIISVNNLLIQILTKHHDTLTFLLLFWVPVKNRFNSLFLEEF